MIHVTTDSVIRTVSEMKCGVSGVVRNIARGFTSTDGTVRQFFGQLHGLDHFEIRIVDIRYKSLSETDYTTMAKPTAYGKTTYGSRGYVSVYENGNMTVFADKSYTCIFRADMYGVFSNGRSADINKFYKYLNSAIAVSGLASSTKAGTGSTSGSLKVLGTYGSFSSRWEISALGATNPYTFYISASDLGGNATMTVDVNTLAVTVDGVSYPIKLVL